MGGFVGKLKEVEPKRDTLQKDCTPTLLHRMQAGSPSTYFLQRRISSNSLAQPKRSQPSMMLFSTKNEAFPPLMDGDNCTSDEDDIEVILNQNGQ